MAEKCANFCTLRYFRLVLREFAQPLETFRDTKQLITVFHDALEAHHGAYEAHVLHRDISAGNIMITHAGKGLLVDWHLSKDIANGNIESPPERTGTWQFMAARLLMRPAERPVPNYTDDLESFWYTLLYTTLRHCDHVCSSDDTRAVINDLFEYKYPAQGVTKGGKSKIKELRTRADLKWMSIRSPPLFRVLEQSAKILAVRYFDDLKLEARIEEITNIEAEYKGDDLEAHLFKLGRIDLVYGCPDWEKVQRLKSNSCFTLFSTILNLIGSRDEERWERDLSVVT